MLVPVNFFLMASLELAYIILLFKGALSGALQGEKKIVEFYLKEKQRQN